MFPESKHLIEQKLRENKSIEEIIDFFLNEDSIALVLKRLSSKIINNDEDTLLEMNRSCLWNKAKVFYKKATTDVSLLKKNLIVLFRGEEGVDGGALRNEFFVCALKQMNDEYFEGREDRRLPKCHWGCEVEQVLAGVLVAHSLLLGGPGFPCLHPAIYDVGVGVGEGYQPTVEDVPVNSATADVLDMINQV